MNLEDVAIGLPVTVNHVGGERSFRRRLMELGIVPGTTVEVIRVAPLGDPIELRVRGCLLSIRRGEARSIAVSPVTARPSTDTATRGTADPAARPIGIQPGIPASP